MRSILSKVVIGALGTFILSLVAYWGISRTLERRGPRDGDPFHRLLTMIEDDTRRAYLEGGPKLLAEHLKKVDEYLPGTHYLTDEQGKDLVTGENRAELLQHRHRGGGPPRLADGRMILVSRPRRGFERLRFIAVIPSWSDSPNILPYYGVIVLVIVGVGVILGMHLVIPLRQLRDVVDRFGRGELSARVRSDRKDEIGELSVAFDTMAARIETLLSAERRLLQDVSHELRSPLARLDVAVELARTSDDPWSALERITRDLGRLGVLVEGLLQLTRAEGDTLALELAPVDLHAFLNTLLDECAVEAEAKRCTLSLSAEGNAILPADRELLRRALENVIRNAIRHAPKDTSIEITLKTEPDTARISVRDFGVGVPDDALEAIFQPFYRVEGHRSRSAGGVGLGLAIARRSVSLHGGNIRAENASPGLRLVVTLPLTSE